MPSLRKWTKKASKKPKASNKRHVGSTMTTYVPRFRTMFASRNFTTFRIAFQGYVPSTTLLRAGLFQITPAQLAVPLSAAAAQGFTNVANGGILTGGSSVGGQYGGYTIASQIWQAYKIHSQKVTVSCVPNLAGDCCTLSMYPTTVIPFSAGIDEQSIASQPFMATKTSVFGDRTCVISKKTAAHQIVGLTKAQWDSQMPTGILLAPVAQLNWAQNIYWATIGGNILNGNLNFTVLLECEVELSDPFPLYS